MGTDSKDHVVLVVRRPGRSGSRVLYRDFQEFQDHESDAIWKRSVALPGKLRQHATGQPFSSLQGAAVSVRMLPNKPFETDLRKRLRPLAWPLNGDVRALLNQMRETKEIMYRGGVVTFSIPKDWVEEYAPEGGGTFYENAPDSGTLRLNVITAQSPNTLNSKSSSEALTSVHGVNAASIVQLPNGNAFATSLKRTSEQGQLITLYWWYVANLIPLDHVRIAAFSYTVLTSKEKAPDTRSDISFIEDAVRAARFSAAVGE